MPALLPPLCFLLLTFWLRRSGRAGSRREALLAAALPLGIGIAVSFELLSLASAISTTSLTIGWSIATLGAATLALRAGPPVRPTRATAPRPSPDNLALVLPLVLVAALTGLVAALAWPNTSDALAYHLPRAMHWAQNGSVAFYPTHVIRQLFNPPWGEYAVLHFVLLGGSDRLASLVQWLAMLGSLVAVSLVARRLGADAHGQLAAALVCATIPMGILQASSTQVDYVTAFWLVCLAAGLLGLRQHPASTAHALAVGAALGLALLTKGTAYPIALPFLALLLPLPPRRVPTAAWLRQLALLALVALALNTPQYLRNAATFGSPLGPTDPTRPDEWQLGAGLRNESLTPALFASNLLRNAALHFGTPWPSANAGLERAVRRAHAALGVDVKDPRTTWYAHGFDIPEFNTNEGLAGSPLHLALVLGAGLTVAISSVHRRNHSLALYALSALLAYLLFSAVVKWQPWHARLQLPLLVLWTPVVGLVLARHARLLPPIAALLLLYALPFLLDNRSHPLLGDSSVLRSGRSEQTFRYRPSLREGYLEAARQVRMLDCDQVGLVLGWDDWEYPFWTLLPEARSSGRIQHVAVETSAAALPPSSPFTPCAILAVGSRAPDTLTLAGRAFRRSWSGSGVRLLTPSP